MFLDFKRDLLRQLNVPKKELMKRGDHDDKPSDYPPGCVARTLLTPMLAVETFDNHRGPVVASMVAQKRHDPAWSLIKRIQVKSTTVQFIFGTPQEAAMFVPDRQQFELALGTEVENSTLFAETYYVQVKLQGNGVKKRLTPDVRAMFQSVGVEIDDYRINGKHMILSGQKEKFGQ